LEEEADAIKETDTIFRGRNYAGLRQEFMIFDGETHLSVVAPAFVRGVKSIYAPDPGR
jgi:hypothetical protein